MSSIVIDDADIERLVQAHILDAIGPEKREELLKRALTDLMAPSKHGGGSMLQNAFIGAAQQYVREHFTAEIEKEDGLLGAELRKVVIEVTTRISTIPTGARRWYRLCAKPCPELSRAIATDE